MFLSVKRREKESGAFDKFVEGFHPKLGHNYLRKQNLMERNKADFSNEQQLMDYM